MDPVDIFLANLFQIVSESIISKGLGLLKQIFCSFWVFVFCVCQSALNGLATEYGFYVSATALVSAIILKVPKDVNTVTLCEYALHALVNAMIVVIICKVLKYLKTCFGSLWKLVVGSGKQLCVRGGASSIDNDPVDRVALSWDSLDTTFQVPPGTSLITGIKIREVEAQILYREGSQGSKEGMLGAHSYRASKELLAVRPMDAATSESARSSMKSSGYMYWRSDYYLQVGNSSSDKMASSEIIGSRTSEPPVGKQDSRLVSRMFPNSHQAKSSRIIEEDDVAGE